MIFWILGFIIGGVILRNVNAMIGLMVIGSAIDAYRGRKYLKLAGQGIKDYFAKRRAT